MTADNIPASPLNTRGPKITLVVARADNGVIGKDGKLPWHIPADLQFFKRVTLGKPVIMGRKTYESIGKPLPRRTNIVVTRDQTWQSRDIAVGAVVAEDLATAFAVAYEEVHRSGVDEIAVIGGADIYRQTLARADRIYLTEVHGAFEGDTILKLDLAQGWTETARERHEAKDGLPAFSFVILDRVA